LLPEEKRRRENKCDANRANLELKIDSVITVLKAVRLSFELDSVDCSIPNRV
jgi:hypothetical protein